MKKLLIVFLLVGCSHDYTLKQAEEDFCSALAVYKANIPDELTPETGSLRARIEAAEEAFCATVGK